MYEMRGEVCIGFASVLSLISLLLLIFIHVGQINTSNVPRGISMASVNVSGYREAFRAVILDDFPNLFSKNGSVPLQEGLGLRDEYYFGLYAHCGYVYVNDTSEGRCSDHTLGHQYQPYETMIRDLPSVEARITESFLPENTTFINSKYTGQSSKAAYWMILLGTICAALAFVTGIPKHNYTFCVSTLFAVAGSILLLIGASIWTVLVNRTADINGRPVIAKTGTVPLGIEVAMGRGLYILWSAFGILTASVIPYMISCCTWRG